MSGGKQMRAGGAAGVLDAVAARGDVPERCSPPPDSRRTTSPTPIACSTSTVAWRSRW
jgi:hypothetical protein